MSMLFGVTASGVKSAPDAPIITNVTDVGTGRAYNNGAATVSFSAPSYDGKMPITSYTVKAYNQSNTYMGISASGASSPITITGLASNTIYKYTVTATNAIGTSVESSFSFTVTATTVPQAPTIGTATDGGTGTTVSVAFTGNGTGGKAVSTYTATSSPGSITGTNSASPITVSGLTTGTAYTFTVTATNANGTSTASAASNSVTPASPSSFESIATFTGNGTATSYTFSSIPQTYKSLQLRVSILGSSNSGGIGYRINGDSTSNYTNHALVASSGSVFPSVGTAGSYLYAMIFSNSIRSQNPTIGITDIIDYASTSKYKTFRTFYGMDANSSVTNEIGIASGAFYGNTNALSSLTVFTTSAINFATGTTIALYGVK